MRYILYILIMSTSIFASNEERFALNKTESEPITDERLDKQLQLLEEINRHLVSIYREVREIGLVVETFEPVVYKQFAQPPSIAKENLFIVEGK